MVEVSVIPIFLCFPYKNNFNPSHQYLSNQLRLFRMIMKFKTKHALITTVVILTLFLTCIVGYVTERNMRNSLLVHTQIGANCVDVNSVKRLTATAADLKSPDYLRLKQQFAGIMKVDKDMHFVYLMGVRNNGKVFFYVDDRPDGNPEGSPPGSPYDEAPKEFNRVMQTGIATVEGPSTDSWGSYASGCAPVIDPKTGKPIAIFAIDFATGSWYWEIISRSAIPAGIIILLMTGLISLMISIQRGELLKKSEEKYRFMFDNNPQPNWIYDAETLAFLEVNEAAINHYGYSREEFLSITIKDLLPAEDIHVLLENIKNTRKLYNVDGVWRNIKKNGDLIYVEIMSHSVIFNDRNARHVLIHDITDRKLAEIALNKSEEQLRKFASYLQNVREEEKVALAREIHDDLGQILVALKIDMGLLKQEMIKGHTFHSSEKALGEFDNIVNLIDSTIKTTRRILNGLRPELLELYGFVGSTKEYIREFGKRHQISCEFECDISNIELDPQQSLAFFRILQEALNNIARHSKATSVKVQLQCLDNKLSLEITDNGVGFDKNKNGRDDSYGMLCMKERVILLKGELYITSEVGRGTSVKAEMPYSA